MTSSHLTCLILPGWQNSGPAHWQSRWEALYGYRRVQQHNWMEPLRGDWMVQLEEAVLAARQPVVLVAHSLGCHLTAAWAQHSALRSRVQAALLVAPPDCTRADLPGALANWRKPVLDTLPFRATCVVSTNDPFCRVPAAQALAQSWGAQMVNIGDAGHINAESGLGDWPAGHALLQALTAAG